MGARDLNKASSLCEFAQLVRFAGVGAICAALNLVIQFAIVSLGGFHYFWGSVVSFTILLPTSFWLHKYVSFHNLERRWEQQAWRYTINQFELLLANLLLMKVFVDAIGMHYLIAILVVTIILFLCNYVAQSEWVFRRRAHSDINPT
jgi:putative flippase GtrA